MFLKNMAGRIKKGGDGKFGTYFLFGAQKILDSFTSFVAAWEYFDREFPKLDTDRANSLALHPVGHDLRSYSELEQVLRERGGGATLPEAVQFYPNHYEHTKFTSAKVSTCVETFLAEERSHNHSTLHEKTLTRHLGHFIKTSSPRDPRSDLQGNLGLAPGFPSGRW